jgi:hypothetical protein
MPQNKITTANINPLQAISAEQTLSRDTFKFKFTKSVPDIASIHLLLATCITLTRQQRIGNL